MNDHLSAHGASTHVTNVNNDEVARKFSYKHTQALIYLSLSLLKFESLPRGALRDAIWHSHSRRFIPLIIVQQVPLYQRPRGRHNSVCYISSRLEKLDEVDKKRPCALSLDQRLAARHPAVAYGILTCDTSGLEVCLTTFTHSIASLFNAILPTFSEEFYECQLMESIQNSGGLLSST